MALWRRGGLTAARGRRRSAAYQVLVQLHGHPSLSPEALWRWYRGSGSVGPWVRGGTRMEGEMAMQSGEVTVVVAAGAETQAAAAALRPAGFRVVTAADADEACDAWLAHRPQAIVLDAALPGVGGLEVCRRVRLTGTTRIVALVSIGDLAAIAAWFHAGADDVVPKPFSPPQLVARLHTSPRRL